MKVVFFGTPDFSVSSLKALVENEKIEVSAVVSMPDRPAGRGKKLQTPPVAQYAKDNNIHLIQTQNINKDEEAMKYIEDLNADFFVVIAFAQFLGKKLLSLPKFGAFNIHTSLLPKYRGAAPIQYALLNGDKETGVSIQKMVSKMDAGAICYEHTVKIDDADTTESLFKKLEAEAALGLESFISNSLEIGFSNIAYREQDESHVSFAPTIKKEDGKIEPTESTAIELLNKMRAYTPWPGQFINLSTGRLKVKEVELFPQPLKPGVVSVDFGALLVGTKEGTIRLKTVQPEGKKAQADKDFLNGLKSKNLTPTLQGEPNA